MKLVLVRHGTTEAVQEKRFQGQLDYPLSKKGRAESAALAERLKGVILTAVFSSPQRRAMETAAFIARPRGVTIKKVKWARERGWGLLEGRTWAEIRQDFPLLYDSLQADRGAAFVPCRESQRHFQARVDLALRWIFKENAIDSTVLLVSHGCFINALLAAFLGLPLGAGRPFAVDPASMSVIEETAKGLRRLRLFNDTCHLHGYLHEKK